MVGGFYIKLSLKEQGLLMNVDPRYNIIRSESVLKYLISLKENCENKGLDFLRELKLNLIGKTISTGYNKNKCYKIDSILFESSPIS